MILLIEDHLALAREIEVYLRAEGWDTRTAATGVAGLSLALEKTWSVILLDLSLPGIDGAEICRRLRAEGIETPIIMTTARGRRRDVISGLNFGADDYLVKPFGLDELAARIRAQLRRTGTTRGPVLTVGAVRIDTNRRQVELDGAEVHLAPREYALFEYLARHRGVPQDRITLLEHVWGEAEDLLFSQTVDVHVSYLRRKLGHDVIVTVPGIGYLVPDD